MLKEIIKDRSKLISLESDILMLRELVINESKDDGMNRIKSIEKNYQRK